MGGRKGKKKEENVKISAKLGQSLGGSWPNRERRVNACFGNFAQNDVILETAGFVSRDF
jgi:formylglycine-generating enzyme required for sulfatase activity